jgi:transposase
MYDSMDRSAVRALRKRKRTYTEIAKELGMDRRTVKSLVEGPTDIVYHRDRGPAKADRFKEDICRWADDDIPIGRMLELVREDKDHPYDGSRSAFFARAKVFIAEHKRSQAERFVRFEGLPGEYCQVDWGEVRNFPFLGQEGETRYFLAVRLKFSRKLFVVFTTDMMSRIA